MGHKKVKQLDQEDGASLGQSSCDTQISDGNPNPISFLIFFWLLPPARKSHQ